MNEIIYFIIGFIFLIIILVLLLKKNISSIEFDFKKFWGKLIMHPIVEVKPPSENNIIKTDHVQTVEENRKSNQIKGPEYYFKEIKKLPPSVRDAAFKKMVGMEVEWNLLLSGFNDVSENKIMISFKDPQSGFVSAYTIVSNDAFPHLNLLPEDTPVVAKGIISKAGTISFELKKATVEQI